jgi:anti-sigma-K factor RskA
MSAQTPFSDEALCAYLDGELGTAERAALEQALGVDEGLRRRLEQFRGVTQLLQDQYADAGTEPAPEALLKAARDLAGAQGAASNVTAFPQRPRTVAMPRWQLPLAAAIALVVGGIAGGAFQAARNQAELGAQIATLDAGRILPSNPLHAALEKTPSGESVTTADASRMRLVLSFAAKDGRFCREFDVAARNAASVGVACRENGAWRLEALLAAKPQEDGVYSPASGYNTNAFDDVVTSLMKDAPLDKDQESALIGRGWR